MSDRIVTGKGKSKC